MHFVVSPMYAELLEGLGSQQVGNNYPYWVGGRYNWVAQSYLVLRQYREGMTIGTSPRRGLMNFGHCTAWRQFGGRCGEFRISVRADYPPVFDTDFEILQNPTASTTVVQAYLPYWPVPGIIHRDSSRQQLRTVAYAGRIGGRNLADDLLESSSSRLLSGLKFVIIPPSAWHDMSCIDLLIAVRSFDRDLHRNKPPSKLFNSWLSGIPLLGGWDSAFSSVGVAGTDYVRVGSLREFNLALERLRDDSAYYDSVVSKGAMRRGEVTHDAIAQQWLSVIDTRITPKFELWKAGLLPGYRQALGRLIDRSRVGAGRLLRWTRRAI